MPSNLTRRLRAPVLATLALAASLCLPAGAGAAADPPAADRYIVVLEPGADAERVAEQQDERGDTAVKLVHELLLNGYTAEIAPSRVETLLDDPRVAFVEPDKPVHAMATQAAPPWGLDRIDQAALPLSGTYSYESSGAGVTAYVIDSGIRATHVDFGGRVGGGFTAIVDGRGTRDCNGHGTHVAGTVGGATYGVAKAVTLVPVRVLDCNGNGLTSGVIAGVEWVSVQPARPAVANMSLGGGPSTALDTAVRSSIARGITYALAAGNEGADACLGSPSRVGEALTIAATDVTDAKPSWSNYGSCVDWFAPGANVLSAYHTADTAAASMSGTSMAAPHTAGAAALFLAQDRSATPARVREALAAALTEGVVTSAASAANHLLRVPGESAFAAPGNSAPQASFIFSCSQLSCQFDASASRDDHGPIAAYEWNFGDGGSGSGVAPSRVYAAGGTYTVTLTVRDATGVVDTEVRQVGVAATAAAPAPEAAQSPGSNSSRPGVALLAPSARRVLVGTVHRGRDDLWRLRRDDSARFELRGSRRRGGYRSELRVAGRAGGGRASDPERLAIAVELAADRPGARLALRLFDFSQGRFETVRSRRAGAARDRRLGWSSDRASAYVSPAGAIRLAVGVTSSGPHLSAVDLVRFRLSY